MSSILRTAVAIAAAACVTGAVWTTARATVRAQTTGTTGTSGTVGTAGSASDFGLANVSGAPAEQLSTADAIVTRGTNLSQRVTQMLDDARREADVIRVTCLNDKLTQINANLRTAQSRYASLQRTVDTDQRKHELTVLAVLGQKLQVLDQESNQCIGQDLYETGPTKIVTEIDTSVLPFETDPATPQITVPTAPAVLGVPPASSPNGV
jgi:hypothetical protein